MTSQARLRATHHLIQAPKNLIQDQNLELGPVLDIIPKAQTQPKAGCALGQAQAGPPWAPLMLSKVQDSQPRKGFEI